MKNVKSFSKGGLHPHDMKHLAKSGKIVNAAIPPVSVVPLSQHIGSPSECLVAVGDKVQEEMLIGKSTGFISANIHSPVPGVVKKIDSVILPTGISSTAVVIELQGEFNRLGKKHDQQKWEQYDKDYLVKKVLEMGVVGMGGATFPTHVKLTVPRQKKVEYFLVNGVECEPYLTADYRVMLERTAEILEGIRIVQKILNQHKTYIGIEINKPDAIELMAKAAGESDLDVEVVPLKMKYPQGDEKQLLMATIGKEVPSGGLPLDIGAVVSNVGTIVAIYDAVVWNKPLIERIVTVSGGAIAHPGNFKVRLGTSVGSLIEEAGGFFKKPKKIVMGGPMMGFALCDLETPVMKGTSGILALTARESKQAAETPCLQCGRCINVCPMGLVPTRLYKNIEHGEYETASEMGLMDCKECGCCGYICPAQIPLVQGMKWGKRMLKKVKS